MKFSWNCEEITDLRCFVSKRCSALFTRAWRHAFLLKYCQRWCWV